GRGQAGPAGGGGLHERLQPADQLVAAGQLDGADGGLHRQLRRGRLRWQDPADEGDPVQDAPARRLLARLPGLTQRDRAGAGALQPGRVHHLAVEVLEVLLGAVQVERHEPVCVDLARAGDRLAVRVPLSLALGVVLRQVARGRALDVHAEGLLRLPRLLPRLAAAPGGSRLEADRVTDLDAGRPGRELEASAGGHAALERPGAAPALADRVDGVGGLGEEAAGRRPDVRVGHVAAPHAAAGRIRFRLLADL